MDKKQLIWILLVAAAAALLLPRLFPATKPQPKSAVNQPSTAAASLSQRWNYGGAAITQQDFGEGRIPRMLLGSLEPNDGYRFQVEIDPRGASVYTCKLAGYFKTVEEKKVKNKTPQQLQEWSYPLLNPVGQGDNAFLPCATERLRIEGQPREEISTFESPLVSGQSGDAQERIVWWPAGAMQAAADGTESVSYGLELYPSQQAKEPSYRLTKTYTLKKGDSSLNISLKVENFSGQSQKMSVLQNGPGGLPRDDITQDFRSVLAGRYIVEQKRIEVPKVVRREEVRGQVEKGTWPADNRVSLGDNNKGSVQPAVWSGQINRFFCSLMYPIPQGIDPAAVDANTPVSSLVVPADQYTFAFDAQAQQEEPNSVVPVMVMDSGPVEVADHSSLVMNFLVYCGPQDRGLFDRIPLFNKLNFKETIQFYSCQWCLVKPLALAVMTIIEWGGKLIGNYGIAIILLVLLIRLLLHPITKRSQVSMMRMQKLGPKMKEVQEKYKDDKAAQQKAMGEVFRQTGVTPILGCLPMLLQMPIWIALYAGLQSSVMLRQRGLLPFWITDLSAPDTILHWTPFRLPLFGTEVSGLNILPLLLTVFMFLQQKLTPMQSAPTTSPEQQKQQKIMMYMTSAIMMFIFYNMPSGLTLYIMASTAAGVIESYVIRKHIQERQAAEAAAETKVSLPGWTPRGQRPKKPKGPFGS